LNRLINISYLKGEVDERATSANTSGWYFTSATKNCSVFQPTVYLHLDFWCD